MQDLRERDALRIWHPATHFDDLQRLPVTAIVSASGSELIAASGARILDAISSWWTCVHGHGHPLIASAVADQVRTLDHVMFAGFTHEPAVALAEGLLATAPGGMQRVFYADCGAAAIEVALKMSLQAHAQRGDAERRYFAALQHGYHGETLGALGLCGDPRWVAGFADVTRPALLLPTPSWPPHADADLGGDLGADAPELERAVDALRGHAHELAALVVEPVVQAAGRMNMPGTGFLRRLAHEARALGIHVIFDEIAVGFGRTGRLLAGEWLDVTPDFRCLGKGLSGGILPLACVLVGPGIDDAFRGTPDRAFAHSHTYTANPIACRAGLVSLELFDREDTLRLLRPKIAHMALCLRRVQEACPSAVRPRQAGFMAAFDLERTRADRWPSDDRVSLAVRAAALERGVLLRPLHDTVYWMPPLCTTIHQLDLLADATIGAVQAVVGRGPRVTPA